MRLGHFDQLSVAAGSAQPLEIGPAGADRHVIIGEAVVLPDRHRADIGVAHEGGGARRVKRNVRGKFRARVPHGLEARHGGIERRLAAARKSNHGDAGRVDARVIRQHIEGVIGIKDHIEAAEQGLVGRGADDPAAGEAVEDVGRHPHLVEIFRPHFRARPDTAGAVQQHHGGKLAGRAARQPQFTGDGGRLAILVAGQKLLIAQGERLDRTQLDTRRQVRYARLGHGRLRCRDAENDTCCPQDACHVFLRSLTSGVVGKSRAD